MILSSEKQPISLEDVDSAIIPDDAPPSYDAPPSAYSRSPEKTHNNPNLSSASSTGSTSTLVERRPPQPSGPFRNAAAWFSFGAQSRTDREVKMTILGLVRDVVKQQSSPAGVSILQSCAEACRARNLPFDAIMQEKSIEGHTPLYWAIAKRDLSKPPSESSEVGVIDMLLSFPLTEATRSDACQACLLQSDEELFQRLRRSPGWALLSGADEMLLGEMPDDRISVRNDPDDGDNGAFAVSFHIAQFQRRMRVSRLISQEFIARGRIWVLCFSIVGPGIGIRNPGAWMVNLYMREPCAPTFFNGRLVVRGPSENGRTSRNPLIIRLRTQHNQQLTPQSRDRSNGLSVVLEDTTGGLSLQYDGSSYINANGSIDIELEASLKRSDSDCTIM